MPFASYILNTTKIIASIRERGIALFFNLPLISGTTDKDMETTLETMGLKARKDFHFAFSPEHESRNNPHYSMQTIPMVHAGATPHCLKVACASHDCIVERTVPVSSAKTAQAAKLLENIFQPVNITLSSEISMLFDRMEIIVSEFIEAVSSIKLFGYTPFYPGTTTYLNKKLLFVLKG